MVTYPISPINWALAGKLTPVKNQGDCLSCYAFAAVGTLEAYVAIRKNTTATAFSVQQIVDCCLYARGGCSGCRGGYHYLAYAYIGRAGMAL